MGVVRSLQDRCAASCAGMVLCTFALVGPAQAQPTERSAPDPAVGQIECTSAHLEDHNPGLADAGPDSYCFAGFISKFGPWRDRHAPGGKGAWGIPQWTIHKVKAVPPGSKVAEGRARPRSWFTIPSLHEAGAAPADTNYRFSANFRKVNRNWYERGHLTQKYLAERLPDKAGWFTHNVVNAVPQRARFNKGPWLTLECFTGAWANELGEVWIISGPVFRNQRPVDWLDSGSARRRFAIAIPDFIFKIVVRRSGSGDGWDALAFVYPQDHPSYKKGPWSPAKFLTSIEWIERLTGETFVQGFGDAEARTQPRRLWPVQKRSFDPSCKRFAQEVL
jgi:DNA/RNA endonuclease G (NUC1)